MRYCPEAVELGVHSGCDHVALADGGCGLRTDCPADVLKQGRAVVNAAHKGTEGIAALSGAEGYVTDGADLGESAAQLEDFPWLDFPGRRPGQDAVQVTDVAEMHLKIVQPFPVAAEVLHDVVAGSDLVNVQ